jgi:hypothetical protein
MPSHLFYPVNTGENLSDGKSNINVFILGVAVGTITAVVGCGFPKIGEEPETEAIGAGSIPGHLF